MAQKYIKDDIVMYDNRIHTIIDTIGLNNYELSYVRHPVNQEELSGVHITPEFLKKNGWKKFKRLMRKKSEQRKELWRKEQLRAFYGLERQTNLRIPSSPLSHSASAHKHAMIKCCNYFADQLGDPHVICYDSETRRSPRREATAEKYGLKVVEADE